MKELTIVKVGGKVIDDHEALASFLDAFTDVPSPKILVHGGGKVASDFGERLGITPKLIDGRRITDAPTLELVIMVYGGLVNKNIVAQLQARSENAIGLTGADANVMSAVKRPVSQVDYGFVGDVTKEDVGVSTLSKLIEAELTPVFCPLTHDKQGNLLNTNADTIASILGVAMAENYRVNLIYCFEQNGVLEDFGKKIVIKVLYRDRYDKLKSEGTIHAGMIPKLDNAFNALEGGVHQVKIGSFQSLKALLLGELGTKITIN
ncbi:acetylglutamate kinase [Roseivirga misakiensis]|uniref:Acetylglutamate kinase n=1 Tax=Roseivirga misakiensis TaxID=1563681 RepID=A0A1E5T2X8_9BACT|nr:acetylglutamate kinase [Roseivirga misakiensis]OEK05735.1 acetylglutamate kinase [Roseivirga misakiensis]